MKSLRILIIEDNPENMELMTYLLTAFGHTPILAVDGEEGIQTAVRTIPDLILCDLSLPKKDGYEVAHFLRAEAALSRVPIIAVTASAMVGDRERVLAAGFDGYISKPISPETFVTEVERYLARKDS